MSTEDNKALVRRFFEQGFKEAAQGNLTHLQEFFADHFHDRTSVHHTKSDLAGLMEVVADTGQATDDFQFEIRHMAAEGELVFTYYQFAAAHSSPYQVVKHVRGVEPDEEEQQVRASCCFGWRGARSWKPGTTTTSLSMSSVRGKPHAWAAWKVTPGDSERTSEWAHKPRALVAGQLECVL